VTSLAGFPEFLHQHGGILGEGAIIERLRRDSTLGLDPHLANSGFIYDPIRRAAVTTLYRQYLEIGRAHRLPMILTASTWRAQPERIAAAGYADRAVNADNLRVLQDLRQSTGAYGAQVMIGGLVGCRGDAYQPAAALSIADAHRYHAWQANELAQAGADFLLGITLPALSEARGLAAALAETGRPYLLSFVVRPVGKLLDGTSLNAAIDAIDKHTQPGPVGYLINCTHPDFAHAALTHPVHCSPATRQRFLGVLANTAALSPEALDGHACLKGADPVAFASAMMRLHLELGIKILGGCCGTDDRHIQTIAERLNSPSLVADRLNRSTFRP
jgi:homocysteine S-methyltransferase